VPFGRRRLRVQLRSRPLALPKPGDVPMPDPRVVNHQDTRAEMMAVAREARHIFNGNRQSDPGRPILDTLLPAAAGMSIEAALEKCPALVLSFELGLAFAEAERRRGWSRPDSCDPRVWSALAVEATSLSEQAAGHELSAVYLAQAGFWVGTRGSDGLPPLLEALTTP
jgi:hypothetical protein